MAAIAVTAPSGHHKLQHFHAHAFRRQRREAVARILKFLRGFLASLFYVFSKIDIFDNPAFARVDLITHKR